MTLKKQHLFSIPLQLDVNEFFNFYILPQELLCELWLSAAERDQEGSELQAVQCYILQLLRSLEIDRKRQVQIMSA